MGCVVFKETLNRLQWAAIIVAAAGVGLQFWLAGSVSWATAWVCFDVSDLLWTAPLARGAGADGAVR